MTFEFPHACCFSVEKFKYRSKFQVMSYSLNKIKKNMTTQLKGQLF